MNPQSHDASGGDETPDPSDKASLQGSAMFNLKRAAEGATEAAIRLQVIVTENHDLRSGEGRGWLTHKQTDDLRRMAAAAARLAVDTRELVAEVVHLNP
jgi:hypothetical protein